MSLTPTFNHQRPAGPPGQGFCRFRRLWRRHFLTLRSGRGERLFDLDQVADFLIVSGRRDRGRRTVFLDQIRGAVTPRADFNRAFQPLDPALEEIWCRTARLLAEGGPLIPVDLVQVGSFYFVRDGLVRVSVARAASELFLEARVEEWEAVPPLPWERGWPLRPLGHL